MNCKLGNNCSLTDCLYTLTHAYICKSAYIHTYTYTHIRTLSSAAFLTKGVKTDACLSLSPHLSLPPSLSHVSLHYNVMPVLSLSHTRFFALHCNVVPTLSLSLCNTFLLILHTLMPLAPSHFLSVCLSAYQTPPQATFCISVKVSKENFHNFCECN